MAETEYPDDIQFAGLVQAATAAADEQTRNLTALGKRKRKDGDDGNDSIPIDHNLISESFPHDPPDDGLQLQNSAAVLFREPSVKSKKYSRPPLGKVYSSLELAPENFLKLQAAGKDFMLDPHHPERRDVVGHRKHSDGNDVAKLKLWNCVEEFLQNEGNGEKFFAHGAGEGIPGAPVRTIFWPEDVQKIIKLCMPLMRKMVTNERQRVYAAETRKQVPSKDAHEEPAITTESVGPMDVGPPATSQSPQQNGITISPLDWKPPAILQGSPNKKVNSIGSVTLYVNLMTRDGNVLKRLIPRFSISPDRATNLTSLLGEAKKRWQPTGRKPGEKETDMEQAIIKVWMSDGLVPINDDGQWMVALLSAETVEWMDGEVRVLIEI